MEKYILTLNERKIMQLVIAEAHERVDNFLYSKTKRTFEDELKNVRLFISDYVTAYLQGDITQSDIERCGE